MIVSEVSVKQSAIYVGVGVGTYEHVEFGPLPQAVTEVKDVAGVLTGYRYEVQVVENPDSSNAPAALKAKLPKDLFDHGGSLVILWSGHGELTPEGKLHLVVKDGDPGDAPLITSEYLAGLAARTGADQILIILDTCYSGAGAIPAVDMADRVVRELPPNTERLWIGVVTSAMEYERAKDGLFGSQLLKLLREGPADPELRLRWSSHNAGVRGDDLIDALIKEWNVSDQRPKHAAVGNPWIILPNPHYNPGAPERVVEHFLLAARGIEPGEEGFYFTGRVKQINRIVSWIRADKPGIFVVSGPAGTGKSAIVGRIVSLSNPEERARLFADASLEHADPGEGSIHAHIQVRGITAQRFCEILDELLVQSGVLPKIPSGFRNRGEILGAIERQRIRPVIVIDGLDEAGSESWQIAEDVIRLLCKNCLVLVSTRELPPHEGGLSLIQSLVSSEIICLGDETLQEEAQDDVRRYVEKRLNAVYSPTDTVKVSDEVVRIACEQGEGMFLLARIITSQLRNAPVDTSLPGWERKLDRSIEEAFDCDILRIGDGRELSMAKELLTALAWGYGSGLPDDIWPIIATAISSTEDIYQRQDIFWLLGKAGRYVVEGGEGGRAVYRLVHQRFVEYLRPTPMRGSRSTVKEDISSRIAPALVKYYLQYLALGHSVDDHPYLWKYMWRHCSDAGDVGIAALHELVNYNRESFEPDLAEALSNLGNRYGSLGRGNDAIQATLEAAKLYRKLASINPTFMPEFAKAQNNLANCYVEVGKNSEAVKSMKKAANLYGKLASNNPTFIPEFAKAQNNLAKYYVNVGWNLEAVKPMKKAESLYSKLASINPTFMPEFAKVQNNLAKCYVNVGWSLEAAKPMKKAERLFSKLASINPAFVPELATARKNLDNYYGSLSKSLEAIKPTERTAELRRKLVSINPAFMPDFAKTQNNFRNNYGKLGNTPEMIKPMEKVAQLDSKLISINPVFKFNLESLITPANRYRSLDKSLETFKSTEKAAKPRHKLAKKPAPLELNLAESTKVDNKEKDDD